MKNMNLETMKTATTKFSLRHVLRFLSVFCFIFCFCPAFLVSCGGETIDVNLMTAVQGVSSNYSQTPDSQPVMLLCYVIPILFLVFLGIRKWSDTRAAGLIIFFGIIDAVFWFNFRSTTKQVAEQLYCTFRVTPWFIFNMLAHAAITVLSALVAAGKARLDSGLAAVGGNLVDKENEETADWPEGGEQS